MSEKLPPVYCKRCGAKLVVKQCARSYDEQTGAPISPYEQRYCPNDDCERYFGK